MQFDFVKRSQQKTEVDMRKDMAEMTDHQSQRWIENDKLMRELNEMVKFEQ